MGVYNDAEYVAKSVESILTQTYEEFEFVIIDDGSTDNSSELLQEYADQDDRITLFRQSNSGLTKALNAGLARADGKYIARMDADDIADQNRLERQVEFLEKNPEIVLVGTQYTEVDADGNLLGRSDLPETDREIRDVLMKYNPFFHASVMMRAETVSSIGGYNASFKYSQDYDLWLRLAKEGELINLSSELMKRRYDKTNISVAKETTQRWVSIVIRMKAIKQYGYSPRNVRYLGRPLLVCIAPDRLLRVVRGYILRNKIYDR